ncbi:MAG TPA: hypothetical protein VFJ49_12740, partial [Methyloceanibacter sp.]|nr:hypothetical protein [Methyloceanibacter sp.]
CLEATEAGTIGRFFHSQLCRLGDIVDDEPGFAGIAVDEDQLASIATVMRTRQASSSALWPTVISSPPN